METQTIDPRAVAAIASPRRREILRLLWDNEMAAGDIADRFDISWPAISQHVRVLRDARLIAERRQGRHRFYRADAQTLGALAPVLQSMWSDSLDRLTDLAESERRDG